MRDYADRLLEIAECELCDDDGLRLNGLYRCDHIDYGAIAKRGIAKVRAALENK
jgi:hypothetical protein